MTDQRSPRWRSAKIAALRLAAAVALARCVCASSDTHGQDPASGDQIWQSAVAPRTSQALHPADRVKLLWPDVYEIVTSETLESDDAAGGPRGDVLSELALRVEQAGGALETPVRDLVGLVGYERLDREAARTLGSVLRSLGMSSRPSIPAARYEGAVVISLERPWRPQGSGAVNSPLPAERALGRFGGLTLRESRPESQRGDVPLTKGFVARVHVSGSVSVRTVPRGALGASVFGVGVGHVRTREEVTDARRIFLVVEGPNWSHVEPVPVEREFEAREFAAALGAAVAAL